MTAASTSPRVVTQPPKTVDLAAIDRELTQLWKQSEPGAGPQQTMTRACMSNLIVSCATKAEADVLPGEIEAIVRLHPARVLLLVGETHEPTSEVEASISALCHLTGDHGQVCSEHVTIHASGDAVRRLPSAARSLLIGDLPTSLWWASLEPPPLGGELFEELGAMAEQVIYSSQGWTDPVRGLAATAAWAIGLEGQTQPLIADLAWRRLKPWRSLIAQALDPAAHPGALEKIDRVQVEHGPHGLTQAWMLAGWLASRLQWEPIGGSVTQGHEVRWKFQSAHGPIGLDIKRLDEGEPEVCNIAIRWKTDGQPAALIFASVGPGRLGVTGQGIEVEPRGLAALNQSRSLLVAAQLQDLERDPVFRDALHVSRTMAAALHNA